MLRLCSQLVNAAVFGSLAVLATKPAPIAELMTSPAVIAALTPGHPAGATAPRAVAPAPATGPTVLPVPVPRLVQGGAPVKPNTPYAGLNSQNLPSSAPSPKLAAPLPFVTGSATPDAVVPPVARRRPAAGPVVAEPAPSKKKSGAEKVAKATPKPSAKATKAAAVETTSATSAPGKDQKTSPAEAARKSKVAADKRAIDLSGRSALGAAPQGLKCSTGLRYDAKSLKCVGVSPKPTASPKAMPTPAPVVAKR